MKKIIFSLSALTLTLAQPAFSAFYRPLQPVYVGAEIGYGNLNYDRSDLAKEASKVDDRGLAGRLLAGVDINRFVGLEMGYTAYSNPEFEYPWHAKTDFSQDQVDMLAKLTFPLSCNVAFFVKGGMAWVHRDDAEVVFGSRILKVNSSDDHIRPELGIGIAYGFNSRVAGTLGYYRTFGTDDLEDAAFYGAGLTFRVG